MRSPDDRRDALAWGAAAERLVADRLRADGWQIVAQNWHGPGGELDLVAVQHGRMRLVEVKARAPDDPVGIEAIDGRKRRRLVRAAEAFLADWHDLLSEVCFLVALVEGDQITWLDNAFDV